MAVPTQAQYVAAYNAAKIGIVELINSFNLPGWEESMVEQYITDQAVNKLSDEVANATVAAQPTAGA